MPPRLSFLRRNARRNAVTAVNQLAAIPGASVHTQINRAVPVLYQHTTASTSLMEAAGTLRSITVSLTKKSEVKSGIFHSLFLKSQKTY